MSFIPFLYLIPAFAIAIILLVSRKEALPPVVSEETQGIRGAFTRAGLFLLKHLPLKRKSRKDQKIRMDLDVLMPRISVQDAGRVYDGDKIGMAMLVLFAGSILAFLISVSARQEHLVDEYGRIARRGPGEGSREETLVYTAGEEEAITKEITMSITEQQYTREEADALFLQAKQALPAAILKDNASPDEVHTDLALVDVLPGYPFSIRWKIGNYACIHSDGKIQQENIPEEGIVVMLTAQVSYLDYEWEQEIPICIYPPVYSSEELWDQGMQAVLSEADEATVHEEHLILPAKIGETAYTWSGKIRDYAGVLFLLILAAASGVYVMKDRDLEDRARKRGEELSRAYPQFVSTLALYLGAGMTVRNIMMKLSVDYTEKRKAGTEPEYLYEELGRAVNELAGGVSESRVYEHFALRCRSQQYIRLGTLLSQNLRRGNGAILSLLREESTKALNERMDLARKRGEEAGTKLLFPMMLMLVVVMVIIMIPAFLSI